jgi:hypothetical protein
MLNVTSCSPFTRSSSPVTPNGVTLARFISDALTPGWISERLDPLSNKHTYAVRGLTTSPDGKTKSGGADKPSILKFATCLSGFKTQTTNQPTKV